MMGVFRASAVARRCDRRLKDAAWVGGASPRVVRNIHDNIYDASFTTWLVSSLGTGSTGGTKAGSSGGNGWSISGTMEGSLALARSASSTVSDPAHAATVIARITIGI